MNEITLESLAKRVEALEREIRKSRRSRRGWQAIVGMFDGDETMKQTIADGQAIREVER